MRRFLLVVAVLGMAATWSRLPTPGVASLQTAELHMSGTPKALETPVATPQQIAPLQPQGDRPQPQH